jgi:hypothetical protein
MASTKSTIAIRKDGELVTNNNGDNSNNATEKLGTHFTSAQYGVYPLSFPVDRLKLHHQLEELRRTLEWNASIRTWKAAQLAKQKEEKKEKEDNEFSEWP